jgi:hypothetical protein
MTGTFLDERIETPGTFLDERASRRRRRER